MSDLGFRDPVDLKIRKVIYVCFYRFIKVPLMILNNHFSVLSDDGEYRLISMQIEALTNFRIYSRQGHSLQGTGAGQNFGTYLCFP